VQNLGASLEATPSAKYAEAFVDQASGKTAKCEMELENMAVAVGIEPTTSRM